MSSSTAAVDEAALPDYAPIPRSALGPAMNQQGYFDEVTAVAAAPAIEKYVGVLAAADVFTESTTFWVMESVRLDLGNGSQVHP